MTVVDQQTSLFNQPQLHNHLTNNLFTARYGSLNGFSSSDQSNLPFKLSWKNLSFTVTKTSWRRNGWKITRDTNKRTILRNINGEIYAGSMTALMGPSGAGKSTVINCISNKLTKGVTGDIEFTSYQDAASTNSLRIGFVPQHDCLFTQFTLTETVMFASRLNNHNLSKEQHKIKVSQVLTSLDLEHEADSKLYSLSGGQLKRTSIATELVSNPRILILDEPTSGQDSDTSEKIIEILKNLRSGSHAPAILATIHQPSLDIFLSFDSIYLLSRFGDNLYNGSPQATLQYLYSFGFPQGLALSGNPADYMIAVANGRFGRESFEQMAVAARQGSYSLPVETREELLPEGNTNEERRDASNQTEFINLENKLKVTSVTKLRLKHAMSFGSQVSHLFIRNFLAEVVKGRSTVAKMLMGFIVAVVACFVSSEPIGYNDGCIANSGGEPNILNETKRTTEGSSFYFMIVLYHTFFYGLAGVLTFHNELKVVSKEVSNAWYGVNAYSASKFLCDSLLLIFCITPMFLYTYFYPKQPTDFAFRPFLIFFFSYTAAFLWEARAQLISIFFNKNTTIAIVFTIGCMFPVVFLCGIYVKQVDMSPAIKPFAYLSDLKYGLEGMILTMYQHRCTGIDNQFDDKLSFMLKFFDIKKSDQVYNILFMSCFCLFSKFAVFIALFIRSKIDIRL